MASIKMRRKISKVLQDHLDSGDGRVLIVKGLRQIGKTYIIEEFLNRNFKNHITLNFYANPRFNDIFSGTIDSDSVYRALQSSFSDKFVGKNVVLFLDEIQFCPQAVTSLKFLAQDKRFFVIASGSLLGLEYREVSSYPVGYERVVEMTSMDFEEFLWAVGIDPETVRYLRECISGKKPLQRYVLDQMDQYYRMFTVVGGMPESVLAYLETKGTSKSRDVLSSLLEGIRNDIGKYSDAKERNLIFACFDSIPMQLAKGNGRFVYSAIPGATSPSERTYGTAVNWLVNSGFVTRCHDLTEPKIPLEAREKGSFKLYVNDTGLLLAMMDPEVVCSILREDVRVNRGQISENLISECIVKAGMVPRYFSTRSMEIDFILPLGSQVAAVEVKSGNNKRSKSLTSVRDNYGVKRRIKFERTNIEVTEDGVEHYPLFAAAFLDSMYVPPDLSVPALDPGALNSYVHDLKEPPKERCLAHQFRNVWFYA